MTRAALRAVSQNTPLFGLTVHHADGHVLVLDKPAGLLMHRTHPRPQVSLLDMVRRERHAFPGRIEVVHRLDRETSGLVVMGCTPQAVRHLAGQFEARTVDKRYVAIVEGEIADDAGIIDLPIGRAAASRVRKKRQVHGERPQAACTRFRVVERLHGYSVVEITPETGRQHQIRVHLAAIGHPLVGDKLYGPDERWHLRHRETGWTEAMARYLTLPRHALHASGLAFDHPESGKRMTFVSVPDGEMAAFRTANSRPVLA